MSVRRGARARARARAAAGVQRGGRALWRTVQEFGENTSFHGVKYMVSGESSLLERVLWLGVLVFGVLGSVYMTLVFWRRYTSNPIRTTLLSSHTPTSAVPFPGVTLCAALRVMPRRLRALLERGALPPGVSRPQLLAAVPALLGYTQPLQVSQAALSLLERFAHANGLGSPERLLAALQPSCKDLLLRCRWKAKEVPCDQLFVDTYSKDGACCTLNLTEKTAYISDPRTFYYGYQMGLSVIVESVLGATSPGDIVSSLQSVGAKVLIHGPGDFPGTTSIEKNIGNGTESFIRLLGTRLSCSQEVQSLDIEQRQCLFEDEHQLKWFSRYKDSSCETECKMRKMLAACGCVPHNYLWSVERGAAALRPCNLSDIACLSAFHPAFHRNAPRLPLALAFSRRAAALRALPPCPCLPNCNDVFYTVQTASTPLTPVPHTASSFYDGSLGDASGRASKMIIHVFFGNHAQVVMLRDRITSTYYLLSSFGGVFSLFLGCSFVSVLEIIYFFCIRLFVNCKNIK